jgi:transposase
MARYTRDEIEQGEIMTIYLADHFDEFSTEFILKEYVEKNIDESVFNKYYQNDERGRKAKHPKDILAGILYGYFNGIQSSRKLEELLKYHLSYKFVTNKLAADHSVICDFKNNCRDEIESMFARVLFVLNEMGGIDFERIVGDGTTIAGQAWKELTVSAKTIDEKMIRFSKLAQKIVERDLENENKLSKGLIEKDQHDEEKGRIDRQKKKYNTIVSKLKEYETKIKKGEIDPDKKYNITDPDSSLQVKGKGREIQQGYNAKMMVSNNDVILSVDCRNTHERNNTMSMVNGIEHLKRNMGIKQKGKYLFDANFFDIRKVLELENIGADMYVESKARDFNDKSAKRKYFTIRREGKDFYLTCIANRQVKGNFFKDSKGVQQYCFQFYHSSCIGCDNESKCFEKVKSGCKTVQFELFELENRPRIDAYLQKLNSQKGRAEYNRRIGKEHVFANIKNQKNHWRTFYRGIASVQMDMLFTAMVHNLGKYIQSIRGKQVQMAI